MPSAVSIRFATSEDIPVIGWLAQQIWPLTYMDILSELQLQYMMHKFYHPASLLSQMQDLHHQFLILEEEGEPLGFASFSETDNADTWKLHKIYVLPGSQGKGLGKLLIDFVMDQAKESGVRKLRLNVNRYNKARVFYERLGFRIVGEEDIDIGENFFMNDFIMEAEV
jgi:GNAT superfamily N-acetyltransferase